ncbi:MAG: hypothetical protein KKH28_03640, partial [Elusimicrobia bacterium]|nr:hypothetical protein [Elusimicrobiota bacterium]
MKARFGISVLFAVLLSSFHAFYSIPPSGEAAFAPARIVQIAVISMPQTCDAGVMDQLCASVTSFLDEESVKSGAAVKACAKNCNWKKHKDELIKAAQKKAKDSCSRGEAPVINEVNKGLDKNAKARLNRLYNQNSQLFDGTDPKLAAKDLEPVPSNQPAELTGKGGQVSDLKGSAPDLYKLSPVTEFSL